MSTLDPVELFGQQAGSVIANAFRHMGIAEEELEAGPKGTPFLALQTPAILKQLADEVYRAHCRELVARAGEHVRVATSAEICAAMMQTSLRHPLNHAAAWLAWYHFDKVFPGKMDEPFADDYDRNELIPEMEKKAATDMARARMKEQE